ncbi:MAG: hypothetical protein HY080_02850 [Gammaproteobacteria bacterium]|nr:hypothetical protein [Gammaproteobacteria bacterium]
MEARLYQQITNLINENIDAGAIDRATVRQIIVGIAADGQSINIWQRDEWEDYCEYADDEAIGQVTNLTWLDLLDQVGFGEGPSHGDLVTSSSWLPNMGVTFADNALQGQYKKLLTARIKEIKDALIYISSEQLLGSFDKLVGLLGMNISNSRYADLVTLYHPLATHLLPASERRLPGYDSIYGMMQLTDDGLIHFYPETEQEDAHEDGDEELYDPKFQTRWYNHYKFQDMEVYTIDRGEVVFRLRSSGQEIEFNHGHSHEEWGWPSQEEIDAQLINHFKQHAPQLLFDAECPPACQDKSAWRHWLSLFDKTDKKTASTIVRNAVKAGDLALADTFIASQSLDKEQASGLRGEYVAYYLVHGLYDEAVKVFDDRNMDSLNSWQWEEYYRALIMLGRYPEVIASASKYIINTEHDNLSYVTHAAFMIIAGINTKQPYDYDFILEKAGEKYRDEIIFGVARALMNYKKDKPASLEDIAMVLRQQIYKLAYARVDLACEPKLLQQVEKEFGIYTKKIFLEKEIQARLDSKTGMNTDSTVHHPFDDFLKAWSTGKELRQLRIQEEYQKLEQQNKISSVLYRSHNEIWVAFSNGANGFARIRLENNKVQFINQYVSNEKFCTLVTDGSYIYATTDNRFHILSYHEHSKQAPVLLYSGQLKHPDRPVEICRDMDTVVIASGKELEIYNVSDRQHPTVISLISLTKRMAAYVSCDRMFLRGNFLYLVADKKGCFALSLSDPAAPKVKGFIALKDSIDGIVINQTHLALYGKYGISIFNIDNPFNPQLVYVLRHQKNWEYLFHIPGYKNGFRFVAGDNNYILQEIIYDFSTGLHLPIAYPQFGTNTFPYNFYYAKSVLPLDIGYLVCMEDQIILAGFESMPVYPLFSPERIYEGQIKLKNWFEARWADFAHSRPADRVGILLLDGNGEQFTLFLDGQRSLPGIPFGPIQRQEEGFFAYTEYKGDWLTMLGVQADKPENNNVCDAVLEWVQILRRQQMDNIFREVLQTACNGDVFNKIAPSRVYLLSRILKLEVFACRFNGGAWQPWRREIIGRVELTLSEILRDSSRWDNYAAKCGQDEILKQELYALGRAGDRGALQVIRRRLDQDEDAVVAVILDVVENLEDYFWLDFIDYLSAREDIQSTCQRLYTKLLQNVNHSTEQVTEWAGPLISVSIMLGCQDNLELDPLIDALLFSEKPDYKHYDQVVRLLDKQNDTRRFAAKINQAIDAMEENDNRLPKLSEQLFRAGIHVIPRGLLLQSAKEKHGEQYNDIKLGIKSLDQKNNHQYDQCRIERLFTSRMLLERFRELVRTKDQVTSLWPDNLELEPYPSSWKLLLQPMLLSMDLGLELDILIEALAIRLNDKRRYPAEYQLFRALFSIMLESMDQPRYSKMSLIVQALPDKDTDEELSKLDALRKTAEINIAWKANQDEDLSIARRYTDKLLMEGVVNPTVYFLDARLSWKEKNDPQVAIEIGVKYMADLHGGSGRARLLNLIGCAYDELKEYPLALKYFQDAAKDDPNTVSYFNNIVEVYAKLEDPTKAYEWAREARHRGSSSEVVKRILSSHDTE